MINALDEYTMPRERALIFLNQRSDRLIVNLENVFKDGFMKFIIDPLNNPSQTV